jgi:hypothetical protein
MNRYLKNGVKSEYSQTVYSLSELYAVVTTLPINLLSLTIEEHFKSETHVTDLPSLHKFIKLIKLKLIGCVQLQLLPELPDYLETLQVSNCPIADVGNLPDTLLDVIIKSHSFVDWFRFPSNARCVTFKDTSLGVLIPPTNATEFRPLRGYINLQNSTCHRYKHFNMLIDMTDSEECYRDLYSPDYPYNEYETVLCTSEDRNTPKDPIQFRMHEAYRIIAYENKYVVTSIFQMARASGYIPLKNLVMNADTLLPNKMSINNLQWIVPIQRAITLASNPLRRALEFIA